jgi:hypothetical protein
LSGFRGLKEAIDIIIIIITTTTTTTISGKLVF